MIYSPFRIERLPTTRNNLCRKPTLTALTLLPATFCHFLRAWNAKSRHFAQGFMHSKPTFQSCGHLPIINVGWVKIRRLFWWGNPKKQISNSNQIRKFYGSKFHAFIKFYTAFDQHSKQSHENANGAANHFKLFKWSHCWIIFFCTFSR